MATKMLNYLGFHSVGKVNDASPTTTPTAVRALPAPWYSSQEMYELERRAIFSRRWLFITHQSRIQCAGEYLRYTIAGYDFVVAKDWSGKINAFHNVCRHRAYPVIEQDYGKASILACKYHGWSYGLNGNLAKAPSYQDLDGFDKSQNGLLPIHVRIDAKGFVWVNMDSSETPEVAWEDDFGNVDEQERFNSLNFDDYVLDHTYGLEGDYNWKILADNFNECYHCKGNHPDIPTFLTIESAGVDTKEMHMQHDHAATAEAKAKGFQVFSTYYFPNASMSVTPHFMMIQKFLPTGPGRSVMNYEVFRNKHSSEEDFKAISETYARVMAEDKVLCDRAQKNINAGVFLNGELHPRWEKGPLYFQSKVREVITEHFNREQKAGTQIWPARQKLPGDAATSQQDLDICRTLDCAAQSRSLAW